MIYLITLEPSEKRYTSQWKKWVFEYFIEKRTDIIEIDGITYEETNNKNFLNPNVTNIWKSEQIIKISNLFRLNKIQENDKFLFYDAWHYGIIALKYMSDLNNIPVSIYGIWHAGSYDRNDLLGKFYKNYNYFEKSIFNILKKSFVATEYHKEMVLKEFNYEFEKKVIITGLPFKFEDLDKYKNIKKEDIIIFPHRMSKEKQPEILKDLEKELNEIGIKCNFCQEKNYKKDEYYRELAKSKLLFSANLQETWGIGTFEGLYLNVLPILPNRLSYEEMYYRIFRYPSNWTTDFISYLKNKKKLLDFIKKLFLNYDQNLLQMISNIEIIKEKYCLIDNIYTEVIDE